MSNAAKVWLIIAAVLVLIGLVITLVAMIAQDFKMGNFSTSKFETEVHNVTDEFSNILIDTSTADIIFAPSNDGKCRVECYEKENINHLVSVSDGTLTITENDTRKWYEHIEIFSFGSTTVTVYLPNEEYASLTVECSTGDVKIPSDFSFENIDISADTTDVLCSASVSGKLKIKLSTGDAQLDCVGSPEEIDVRVSTGDIRIDATSCSGDIRTRVSTGQTTLKNVTCSSLYSVGDTGDLILTNVVASNLFSIERDTGDVKFTDCDATEIFIKTTTGDVIGSLLSSKIFFATTDTGYVKVPHTTEGGKCEITTDTGDIKIEIAQ
jgi:DUF4097 and DUF4098 domain-containing protein YvlB